MQGGRNDTHDVTGGKFRRGKLIKEKFGALRARRACAHFHCTVPLTGERRKSKSVVGRHGSIHETLSSFWILLSSKTPFGDAEILSKKKTTAAEMPEALSELASFREELIGRGEIKYEREESAN